MADFQAVAFDYVDRFRDLASGEAWQSTLMDLSKNDALALLHLHRAGETRMSDLADYLRAPLNTATGVVARLTRRGFVERRHSPDDKRVVVVGLTDQGRAFASQAMSDIARYGTQILGELSEHELALLLRVVDRALAIIRGDAAPSPARTPPRRIVVE